MKIILLIHHENTLGYSMNRYGNFILEGMCKRGHNIEVWAPKLYLSKYKFPAGINKWLRYIDQYLIFPIYFKKKSKVLDKNVLFVLIDQALSMWMPLIRKKNHIVHCHDFIALKSALGTIKENPTSTSGKIYQRLILRGLSMANNFVCISNNTKQDLLYFLKKKPIRVEQVYNALHPIFVPGNMENARIVLGKHMKLDLKHGYILHVGGNTFYKNRIGVITLYNAWRNISEKVLPLIMIGYKPSTNISVYYERSPYKEDIYFLEDADDNLLSYAYQGGSVFVFPSLEEGFGFPIIEAMAAGCPVLTTNKAPMNEVGGSAAIYLKRSPNDKKLLAWALQSAKVIENILQLNDEERSNLIHKGLDNISKFDENIILNHLEEIYLDVLANHHTNKL
ncbi:glycosyltransferase family 1 protein [uncultured Maribacter sp.]|uniref:glycosyltransferase family 4 protein n=1 Tax=uncultured Maribacter sp. TaxID=431308 RepID=UPI00262EE82C|nr:glycosyltransferase family 1 protein [uncultured Maribacter sp.]